MAKYFVTDGPLLPHDPPLTGLFHRTTEFSSLLTYLNQEGRSAIWAPRYSGRTTFLYSLEDRLRRMEELAVYVSPEEHLDLTDRGSLFRSLAEHVVSQAGLPGDVVAEVRDWNKPDSLTGFLYSVVIRTDAPRVTIILDDCDKLLSASLVLFLRMVRSIEQLRLEDEVWRRIAFVVAGSVSFRNLKLLESSELSPFERWRPCHLLDLAPAEALRYLRDAFLRLRVNIEQSALESAVAFAGGDLRSLNMLGREIAEHYLSGEVAVTVEAVKKLARDITSDYLSDASIAYMLSVIAHDPRCLQVVDRLLTLQEAEEVSYSPDDLYPDQKQRFELSNQELSGGFILKSEDGVFVQWLVRNRFRGEVLRRHFSTRRLARALLDLGQFQRAEPLIKNRLASELAKDFRDTIVTFDEAALRDVIEWFWSSGAAPRAALAATDSAGLIPRSGLVDRVVAGFEALAFVLERVFSIERFLVYEVDSGSDQLVANEFVPGSGRNMDAPQRRIALNRRGGEPPSPEVRAYTARVYTIEIEEYAWLKMAIPLKNVAGEVTGVLSCRTERYMKEDWATIFVRVPVIERAVNSIWRLLSRYETDQYKGLSGVMPLISIEFKSESYRYFQKHIARFPEDLPVRFLEFKKGIVINEIIRSISSPRSLLIFDLSHINANVMFELGLAIGLNRPGLPVREVGRELDLEPLEGLVRETFQIGRILGESFFDQMRERWTSYQVQMEEVSFVHLLNEEVAPAPVEGEPVLLVVDHNRYKDSVEYRRAVEKAARRAGINRAVYLWQGGARDDRFTQEARMEDTSLLLSLYKLVERSRIVVARIEKIQDEEHHALRFLVTGIAMGLSKRRKIESLVLTARTTSKEGRATSLPGDFRGCAPIHFSTESIESFIDDLEKDFRRMLGVGMAAPAKRRSRRREQL